MGELPSRASLEMSLLLFTLFSTALALPAHPCPPFPPTDCGEGMRSCPGEFDPQGCRMPETCVAEGDECPFICPHVEHPHCGFVMSNCAGPVDANGCETPMNCVMVDWAAGESCPHVCPHVKHPHCGFVMGNCEGPRDEFGCETPMYCVMVDWAAGEQCPAPEDAAAASCPPWSPTDCGKGDQGQGSCVGVPSGYDARGCPMPDICSDS